MKVEVCSVWHRPKPRSSELGNSPELSDLRYARDDCRGRSDERPWELQLQQLYIQISKVVVLSIACDTAHNLSTVAKIMKVTKTCAGLRKRPLRETLSVPNFKLFLPLNQMNHGSVSSIFYYYCKGAMDFVLMIFSFRQRILKLQILLDILLLFLQVTFRQELFDLHKFKSFWFVLENNRQLTCMYQRADSFFRMKYVHFLFKRRYFQFLFKHNTSNAIFSILY